MTSKRASKQARRAAGPKKVTAVARVGGVGARVSGFCRINGKIEPVQGTIRSMDADGVRIELSDNHGRYVTTPYNTLKLIEV